MRAEIEHVRQRLAFFATALSAFDKVVSERAQHDAERLVHLNHNVVALLRTELAHLSLYVCLLFLLVIHLNRAMPPNDQIDRIFDIPVQPSTNPTVITALPRISARKRRSRSKSPLKYDIALY